MSGPEDVSFSERRDAAHELLDDPDAEAFWIQVTGNEALGTWSTVHVSGFDWDTVDRDAAHGVTGELLAQHLLAVADRSSYSIEDLAAHVAVQAKQMDWRTDTDLDETPSIVERSESDRDSGSGSR